MAQDHTKKEALFNEVKGSLFEYLVGKEIAREDGQELAFQKSLDENYLRVLAQQDRMVRQFYPEMLPFLQDVSKKTVAAMKAHFKAPISKPRVMGKFGSQGSGEHLHETDLLVEVSGASEPVSLKLNKKNAYVNTKSGGIKSFFSTYFSFLDSRIQQKFNDLVDLEFGRVARELHDYHELEWRGDFSLWCAEGFSELPGELGTEERALLKAYYARIAKEMHGILSGAREAHPEKFGESLLPLMGFGLKGLTQVVCFHEFGNPEATLVEIHEATELKSKLPLVSIQPFGEIASTVLDIGDWSLQLRVKPMNKFTTTAIKINCSVKVKRPSDV